jgi:hypothetical protein
MSQYKELDKEYQEKKYYDPNYDDPKWCAIEELENRIEKIEKGRKNNFSDSDSWKKEPASNKQKAFLINHNIPFNEPLNKGEASEKIERYIEATKKSKEFGSY